MPDNITDAVEAVGQTPEAQGVLQAAFQAIVDLFGVLPVWAQGLLLIVLAGVTVAAHIAPYTKWTGDDWLYNKRKDVLSALKWVFSRVAGNYGAAKNHAEVKAEKAAGKAEK